MTSARPRELLIGQQLLGKLNLIEKVMDLATIVPTHRACIIVGMLKPYTNYPQQGNGATLSQHRYVTL